MSPTLPVAIKYRQPAEQSVVFQDMRLRTRAFNIKKALETNEDTLNFLAANVEGIN